jgi:hypothetical protein
MPVALAQTEKGAAFSVFDDAAPMPQPKWQNGLLVSPSAYVCAADSCAIRLYDSNGKLVRNVFVSVPDVSRMTIYDFSVDAAGRLAVSASATSDAGQAVFLLMVFDSAGSLTTVTRTNPFVPRHLVFASDGAIWACGRVTEGDRSEGVLRRFLDGRQVAEYLPLRSFDSRTHPALTLGGVYRAALVANASGVGFYTGVSGDWFFYANDGTLSKHVKISSVPQTSRAEPNRAITGFGLTNAGDLYVSFFAEAEVGIYKLDSNGAWERTAALQRRPTVDVGPILGADGSSIVYRAGSQARLIWAAPK